MGKKRMAPVRVWADGCFDLIHFGHANLLRQAKLLGDYLIAGVPSDTETLTHKGLNVFTAEERYEIVSSMKWVDEVARDAPYCTSVEVMRKYNCDFTVHGDDTPVSVTGEHANFAVIKAGMYREVDRTEGISTTDIIDRVLLKTKAHHIDELNDVSNSQPCSPAFLKKMKQFSSKKKPKLGDSIVYVAGAFDCFHVGHVKFLEKAANMGDFLIVGVHSDKVVNRYCGENYPILNLYERVLILMACKFVDEVIFGAPLILNHDILDRYKINLVVQDKDISFEGCEPYKLAQKRDLLKVVDSGSSLTTEQIVNRINERRSIYLKRNDTKKTKELIANGTNQ
ncbi:unnamed protein product [Clavelina lepadiformis]|uniref:ethanolamine-phosphate cytidylyltransferase n=1 Tax=Clavelina lepadiformis TaxID=159417 RepID=A0ABP0GYL7_CLALP